MTPCVIEDGAICYSAGPPLERDGPVCVGCVRSVETINTELGDRGAEAIYPSDVGRQSGGARGGSQR